MNYNKYLEMMVSRPNQDKFEFWPFLTICNEVLNNRERINPTVVELGVLRDRQRKFYETFLKADYIGIDSSERKAKPDILGDTHDPQTVGKLRDKLSGRMINVLFIDASHSYEAVKRDYEIYEPMTTDIVAFHDIHYYRGEERNNMQVWRFWDELTAETHKRFIFIDIHRGKKNNGIGVIVKI